MLHNIGNFNERYHISTSRNDRGSVCLKILGFFAGTLEYAVLSIFEDMPTPGICGVKNEGAEIYERFGSNHSAYSGSVQRGNQLVRGTKSAAFESRWYHSAHRIELLGRVSAQISLCSLNISMTEPKRDLADIPRRL